jgi:hypothetical protein
MNLEFQPNELEKKRQAMWAERYKPGMSLTQVFELNNEERQQKARDWEGVPEFIL